jgi:hypothetical protein
MYLISYSSHFATKICSSEKVHSFNDYHIYDTFIAKMRLEKYLKVPTFINVSNCTTKVFSTLFLPK